MAAATAAIDTKKWAEQPVPMIVEFPMKANAIIYAGTMFGTDATGYAVPVTAAAGIVIWGRALEDKDNTGGASGAIRIKGECGIFRWQNAESITIASRGLAAYGFDNQSVKTTATGLSKAGLIFDVDSVGVWVLQGLPVL